jgi:hypothetical protein
VGIPTTAIVSLLYVMENGASAEIAVVGNEGIVGVAISWEATPPPVARLFKAQAAAFGSKPKLWNKSSIKLAPAVKLQKAWLIRYQRGRITVLNRPGLEGRTCECYAVVQREYARLLPQRVAGLCPYTGREPVAAVYTRRATAAHCCGQRHSIGANHRRWRPQAQRLIGRGKSCSVLAMTALMKMLWLRRMRAYRMISTNRTQALNIATSMERITPAANAVMFPGNTPQRAKPDHMPGTAAICNSTALITACVAR